MFKQLLVFSLFIFNCMACDMGNFIEYCRIPNKFTTSTQGVIIGNKFIVITNCRYNYCDIYSAQGNELLASLVSEGSRYLKNVIMSKDESLIITGDDLGYVTIWQTDSWQQLYKFRVEKATPIRKKTDTISTGHLPANPFEIQYMCLNDNNDTLVIATSAMLLVYSITSDVEIKQAVNYKNILRWKNSYLCHLCFLDDNNIIFSAYENDAKVAVGNINDLVFMQNTIATRWDYSLKAMALSRDKKLLVLGSKRGEITFFEILTDEQGDKTAIELDCLINDDEYDDEDSVDGLAISPDKKYCAAIYHDASRGFNSIEIYRQGTDDHLMFCPQEYEKEQPIWSIRLCQTFSDTSAYFSVVGHKEIIIYRYDWQSTSAENEQIVPQEPDFMEDN